MSSDDRASARSNDEGTLFPDLPPVQSPRAPDDQSGRPSAEERVERRRQQWRDAGARRRARWRNPPIGWVDPDAPPRGLGDNPGSGRRSTYVPPCPCECNSGGFCGGCGHAGCGGRR